MEGRRGSVGGRKKGEGGICVKQSEGVKCKPS